MMTHEDRSSWRGHWRDASLLGAQLSEESTALHDCATYTGYFAHRFQLTDSPGASAESFLGLVEA